MSLRSTVDRSALPADGLAVKLAVPIAALLLVPIWIQVLGSAMNELDRHLLDLTNALLGWATVYWSVLYLVFLVAFVGLFVSIRSVDVRSGWPDRTSVPTLAVSVLVPVALVAATAYVTTVGDVHFLLVSNVTFPWFAPAPLVYVASTMWLLVGVVTAVGLFHVVLQSELRTHVSPATAVGATTAVGGVLFATQGFSFGVLGSGGYPVQGEYLALLALVAAIGLAVGGVMRAGTDWLRYASVLPLALLVVGTVAQFFDIVDTGAFVGSPIEWAVPGAATMLFAVTAFAMVGLAAFVYERSETVLAPALVYAVTYAASAVALLTVGVPTPF